MGDSGEVQLCPKHAFEYERRRRVQGCKFQGCTRLGVDESGGVRLCKVHSRRPSPRKRSPARTVPTPEGHDPEEPELPPPQNDPPVRLRDLRKVLDEIRDGGHDATPVKGYSKSPGNTPRNTISKNLARLGLLDSPAKTEAAPLLEDFFHQYAEGRELGL